MKIFSIFVVGFLLMLLAGCGSSGGGKIFEDRKYQYQRDAGTGRDLEVPPDLIRDSIGDSLVLPSSPTAPSFGAPSGIATASSHAPQVLPQVAGIEMQRDGDQRWLLIRGTPAQVWPQVVAFWQESGITLVEQNPTLGVLSTDWIENRADIASDFITDRVRGLLDGLYSAPTRDQYRVRLEPTREGHTELYLTHRGVVQEFVTGTDQQRVQGVWQPRPTDRDAEAEMLRRLMLYLGMAEQQVAAQITQGQQSSQQRSALVKGADGVSLTLHEEPSRSWRLVGVALDRVGFLVEERNREESFYLVRYDDPLKGQSRPGTLSRLAFWRRADTPEEGVLYRVVLRGSGSSTGVHVANPQGEPLKSATAERILTLVHEQIQ